MGKATMLALRVASPVGCAHPGATGRGFLPRQDLRMLIGYGPGGGYDIYGRLVAEPAALSARQSDDRPAQNMPGAGSFVAAKYMHDVAPKDGTVFGKPRTLALDSMTNTSAKSTWRKCPMSAAW